MFFASSCGRQSGRIRPCTSQLVQVIEGLAVASCTILERGGGVVCVVEQSVDVRSTG